MHVPLDLDVNNPCQLLGWITRMLKKDFGIHSVSFGLLPVNNDDGSRAVGFLVDTHNRADHRKRVLEVLRPIVPAEWDIQFEDRSGCQMIPC